MQVAWPRNADGRTTLVAVLVMLVALLVWLGGVALVIESARLDDLATGKIAVLFWPPPGPEASFGAIVAAGGEPVRPILGSVLWVAHSDAPGFVGRLRDRGARAGFAEIRFGPALAGCFAFLANRRKDRPAFRP